MKFFRHFVKDYPLSTTCIVLIWILSLMPFFPETPLDNVELVDKWVHVVMYGGTCAVIWIEYARRHQTPDYGKLFFWAWLAPVLMSGLLELLQEYCTVIRTGSWLDFAANVVGATLGAIIGWPILRLFPRHRKDTPSNESCNSGGRLSPPDR